MKHCIDEVGAMLKVEAEGRSLHAWRDIMSCISIGLKCRIGQGEIAAFLTVLVSQSLSSDCIRRAAIGVRLSTIEGVDVDAMFNS